MDKENFLSLLEWCDIYQLRRISRTYGITPSNKKRAELINEIKSCVMENKVQVKSTRGRKPKRIQLEDEAVLLKGDKESPISAVEQIIDTFFDEEIKLLYKLKQELLDLLK